MRGRGVFSMVRAQDGNITADIRGVAGEYIFEQIGGSARFYELDLLRAVSTIPIRNDGLIVDVGANIGNHSLYWANTFSNPIVAVEPEPLNAALLRENLSFNGFADRSTVHEVALWHETAPLELSNNDPTNRGKFSASQNRSGTIEGVRLDSLVGDRPVSLIKIDVEGAELHVLKGGREVLGLHCPVVVLEAQDATATRECGKILGALGYEVVFIGGRTDNLVFVHPEGHGDYTLSDLKSRLLLDTLRRQSRTVSAGMDRISRRLDAESNAARAREGESEQTPRVPRSDQRILDQQDGGLEDGLQRLARKLDKNGAAARRTKKRVRQVAARVARIERNTAILARNVTDADTRTGARLDEVVATGRDLAETVGEISRRLPAPPEGNRAELELRQGLAHRDRTIQELRSAYRLLSQRHEEASPATWSTIEAERTLDALVGSPDHVRAAESRPSAMAGRVREVWGEGVRGRDRVRIGIATMPGREAGLQIVLNRLSPQADEIFVYLNRFEAVPPGLSYGENVRFFTGPDEGDRGKFLFANGFEGYYLTCDDDIEYPSFYVSHLVDGIERYGRRAAVGWHGSIFQPNFSDYYDAKSRRVLAYYSKRSDDTPVHLLGTGAAGFHTSTISVDRSDFQVPNMGDVWLALKAQKLGIPMVVLAHDGGLANPIDRTAPSISNASLHKSGADHLDVRRHVTSVVKAHRPWKLHPSQLAYQRPGMRVAIIGRTDRNRWTKGGILKSSHLTADALRRFGTDVRLYDIETGDTSEFEGFVPDIVIIYVGDPDRPDFATVEALIRKHALAGKHVIVNLSLQGRPERTELAAQKLQEWNSELGGRVHLMAFTEAARAMAGLERVANQVVVSPKTLELPPPPRAQFALTSGVFVGDIAKLADHELIGGSARKWIGAIREALPGVKIYGVQQYRPKYPLDVEIDEVWPYLRDDFSSRISAVRLMVAPVKFATYEMVPMEVSALGVPVVYRRMPQSLSETIGLAGVQVDEAGELAALLPTLYHDPAVWRSFSEAGVRRARSQDLDSSSGQLYLRLRAILDGEAKV
jgi:FkbM family methyltransferase